MTPRMTPRFVYAYLNQGDVWFPNGQPKLPISEMDVGWRGNAVRWLERHAHGFLLAYSLGELESLSAPVWLDVVGELDGEAVTAGPARSELDVMGEHAADAFEAEQEDRQRDPVVWIRSTKLHKALVAS